MMRYVLAVVVALVVAGSTLADEEVVCTVETSDTEPLHSKFVDLAFQCLATDQIRSANLQDSAPLATVQAFFKDYCENITIYQTCLEEVAAKSPACLNETRHQAFLIMKDIIDTVLNTGCQNDGELMASSYHGYDTFDDSLKDYSWQRCFGNAVERIKLATKDESFDVPAKIFVLYNELLVVRDCFKDHIGEGEDAFSSSVDTFITEILKTMKCIHPQNKSTVLCKTLDIGATDGLTFCTITREENDTQIMQDIIIDRMEACINELDPSNNTLDEAKGLESYQTYFKDLCSHTSGIEKCLSKATLSSDVCSNKAEHETFKILVDFMMIGIDHGCIDDGEPLSEIFHSLAAGHENTVDTEKLMMRCFVEAQSSVDETGIHGKRQLFHRALGSFKGCLIGELRGHNGAVFFADQLFNKVLREMKCLDPVSGKHVQCETLAPHSPTETRLCPFVSGREIDAPLYAMFVDMGLACLRVTGQDFGPIKEESADIEALGAFFRKFCDDVAPVEHCLKDMDANGKVCLTADEHQMYHIFIGMMGNSIKSGCDGDGGNLASIVYGMKKYEDALKPCKEAMIAGISEFSKQQGNITAVSMEQFRQMNTFTECYSSTVSEEGEFKTDSLAFLNTVLKQLQCVHSDGSTVPCETIVNSVHAD